MKLLIVTVTRRRVVSLGQARHQRGDCYHVLNRGDARAGAFHKNGDDLVFLEAVTEAGVRVPIRVLSGCLMPNHFHFVIFLPREYRPPARNLRESRRSWKAVARRLGSEKRVWRGRTYEEMERRCDDVTA
jgi:putative transposase